MIAVIINPEIDKPTLVRHRGGLLKIVEELHKLDREELSTFCKLTELALNNKDIGELEDCIQIYNANFLVEVYFYEEVPNESELILYKNKD